MKSEKMVPLERKEEADLLALEECFVRAINQVADKELMLYLKEAWRCYTASAYSSSIVWTWCAVSYYIRQVVQQVGIDVFEFKYGKKIEDLELEDITDDDLITTCKKMNLFGLTENPELLTWLNQFRIRRNKLAHGEWLSMETSPKEAVKYIEEAVRVLLKTSHDKHRLMLKSTDIHDLAMKYKDDLESSRVREMVDSVVELENRLGQVCHSLLDACADSPKNDRVLRAFWLTSYERVAPHARPQIIEHAIRLLAEALGLRSRFKDGKWEIAQELKIEHTFGKKGADRAAGGMGPAGADGMADPTGMDGEDENNSKPLPVVNDGEFWRLFRINIWALNDLPDCHREGFYSIIKDLLEGEITRKQRYGDTKLLVTDLDRIIEFAPARDQLIISQKSHELRRSDASS